MKTIINFLSSKTNESLKRLIAILFSIALIVKLFLPNTEKINELLIICITVLIALLLSLATAETIVSIFKKEK